MQPPILEVNNLRVEHMVRSGMFRVTRGRVRAVDGLSLSLNAGEALGIAGESGSGKTTLARVLVGLQKPSSGDVKLFGEPLPTGPWSTAMRKRVQMVFQDASGFLDPRQPVVKGVMEPLSALTNVPKQQQKDEAYRLLERVGLQASQAERLPHELSGGQRQRVAIARALAAEPELIILDEPTSALDVSVQAQILNLLDELRDEKGMSYLLISHDLNVIAHMCDRVAVMYLGRMVETGPITQMFLTPEHPYTKALLSAIPDPNPNKPWDPISLGGEMPSSVNPPTGCPFHPRCPVAIDICKLEVPVMREHAGLKVACHLVDGPDPGSETRWTLEDNSPLVLGKDETLETGS